MTLCNKNLSTHFYAEKKKQPSVIILPPFSKKLKSFKTIYKEDL